MTANLSAPVAPEVQQKLIAAGTAAIANVLYRRGFRHVMPEGIQPLSSDQAATVGRAFTLRFIPSREDLDSMDVYSRDDNLHRRAIEECPEGSVLVIDAQANTRASSMGDLMATRLRFRGAAGVVTDGGYRDTAGIQATGLPCFQKQTAPPATPIALHPVALQEPIGCGGVAVYPGDIVFGDSDGVVFIPAHLLEEVAEAGNTAAEYEEFAAIKIREGRSILGLFPATEESTREYNEWASSVKPDTTKEARS